MNTIQGSTLQTHVFTGFIHDGLQWALFVASHELSLCSQEHQDRLFLVMQFTNFLESETFMKPH